MDKFHVNPKTGNAGACKSVKGKCPFGEADDHFATKPEARVAYEKKQEIFEQFAHKTKMPAVGAYTLAVYDPMSEKISSKELWGNKIFGEFSKKMTDAEDGTRLVIENGQVWQKNDLYGDESWKFVAGDYDQLSRLERGRTYDSSNIGHPIMQYGARLENGGTNPRMAPEHRAYIYPDREEIDYEAGIIGTTFTKDDGGGSENSLNEFLDDYVVERWSELNPLQRSAVRDKLQQSLGEPTNLGDDENPSWIWKNKPRSKR